MIKVSEFLNSLNTKQFCIKIQVQREDFANIDYTFGNHIHFDNDSIRTTLCQFSDKNCLFIIEGKTESGHEVKLFWGEKHFELLKQINICNETITEYNLLKQQIQTDQCIDLKKKKKKKKKNFKQYIATQTFRYDTSNCHSNLQINKE